ncbi:MAG: nucleotidyltransferase domain-containing protein [Chloroflexi bacterium]|nr:nucleotidyltransferase domain-containing protein [Ardenticatenaceae bacterium]MBL1131330.1 nucleotidyltransferase domain-containing protein [Chloroflexota bacterium]NOG37431.1 nucleotidyltransferase domain-containing protein [Chloroflexota bacterium]
MHIDIPPEKIARYRATALKRQSQEAAEMSQRRQKAWQIARQTANMLREEFNASRVVVFGSLARNSGFTRWSDIDIAAWGLSPEDTFRAMGAVMDLQTDIPVNLVDVNTARPTLLAAIERDGVSV